MKNVTMTGKSTTMCNSQQLRDRQLGDMYKKATRSPEGLQPCADTPGKAFWSLQACLREAFPFQSLENLFHELGGLRPPRTEEIKTTCQHVKECPGPKNKSQKIEKIWKHVKECPTATKRAQNKHPSLPEGSKNAPKWSTNGAERVPNGAKIGREWIPSCFKIPDRTPN